MKSFKRKIAANKKYTKMQFSLWCTLQIAWRAQTESVYNMRASEADVRAMRGIDKNMRGIDQNMRGIN